MIEEIGNIGFALLVLLAVVIVIHRTRAYTSTVTTQDGPTHIGVVDGRNVVAYKICGYELVAEYANLFRTNVDVNLKYLTWYEITYDTGEVGFIALNGYGRIIRNFQKNEPYTILYESDLKGGYPPDPWETRGLV